ncbi:ATP-binding protein [uncultured Streptococcus sp.]|uniref:ATP-binding protein n=1 Tax=uncultured Streptococcus sp. TaxID=83427 RepID=UPI002054FED2|nr:ATP-binding protein [uncultured Streptococcus sp.]DAR86096.1 MAG TPA: AAA domain protein [Caudoviricetes sp.]
MQITRGKRARAQKVVIYGPEGIGKSTFAAEFPNPVFIDTEGSTDNMDVARLDKPTSWTMLNNEVAFIKANSTECGTLVIDTIDWAESMAVADVCAQHGKKGIEDFGWGKGYTYVQEEMGRFLNSLSDLVDMGINVVLTAHAQIKKFEQPDEMGSYDRYELKLGQKTGSKTAPLVKEWADMVLFANYKTLVMTTESGKKKAQGGERVMYTNHRPAWDAKNRHGLLDELPFNYAGIAHIFASQQVQPIPSQPQAVAPAPQQSTPEPQPQPTQTELPIDMSQVAAKPQNSVPEEPQAQAEPTQPTQYHASLPTGLTDLMKQENVTEEELQKVAYIRGHFPLGTPIENFPPDYWDMIVAHWQATMEVIQNQVRAEPDLPFTM